MTRRCRERGRQLARVCVISLGCPKNLVDAEGACGEIAASGHELVGDPSEADVVIINTCAFIESAREESVEVIESAVAQKEIGRCRAVIVSGCLAQRYGVALAEAEPAIDGIVGIHHAGIISDAVESALAGNRVCVGFERGPSWVEHSRRLRCTPPWTAYLKISDGCDNRCSYCAIPDIRGSYISRPPDLIIGEAERLANEGVKELVLVGQDVTQYGADLECGTTLVDLLEKLSRIESLRWIRLMYCYPTKISRDLITFVSQNEKIVKYIDVPFQHADDRILRAMNRQGTQADYLRLVDEIREWCPDIALRTSFITGFPGETEEAFESLLEFVERIRFDRVGVFEYSPEEGTPAYRMKPRVPARVARKRRETLMRLQQEISLERNRSLVGKRLTVLVEQVSDDGFVGRSYRDAPEIDGTVCVEGGRAEPGEFVEVEIVEAFEYDLRGVPCAVAAESNT
ncbi:MAG: 30S ribosomal protein S12 methylthiotransferase RimO [Armatimonadota bacterium]|nr:30S ribosomal protein S12 methylthiotransferase RimO [Armatimonadota bacterium]